MKREVEVTYIRKAYVSTCDVCGAEESSVKRLGMNGCVEDFSTCTICGKDMCPTCKKTAKVESTITENG